MEMFLYTSQASDGGTILQTGFSMFFLYLLPRANYASGRVYLLSIRTSNMELEL
jgi:hypothetical protein